ncbi:MAG TPA: DoxX family protein [Candidatus Acidoferrales bacterium]|nr:DoxX family protein [Candidatus Acidoferrales bacterium]
MISADARRMRHVCRASVAACCADEWLKSKAPAGTPAVLVTFSPRALSESGGEPPHSKLGSGRVLWSAGACSRFALWVLETAFSKTPQSEARWYHARSVMAGEQHQNRNACALAFLRIGVGIFFLIFGEYKVFGTQFTLAGGFQMWINRFLEGGVYPFMAPVLRGFVLPHATPIAFAVAYGELCIGLALVLGILVRAASTGGLLLMLAMLFSADYPGANAAFWQYFGASLDHSIFALCFVTFIFGRADEVWSVRAWRASAKKVASGRTWRRVRHP